MELGSAEHVAAAVEVLPVLDVDAPELDVGGAVVVVGTVVVVVIAVPGMHWEKYGLEYMQDEPATQEVAPDQPIPPPVSM
jgi:hypothetical protein